MLLVQSVQQIARGVKQNRLSRRCVFNLQSCALGVASSGGIRNRNAGKIASSSNPLVQR